jgi:carbon monoxide dehydrogenase subunit G
VAIEIKERFCVAAPVDAVWRFVMDPEMPGAALDEVVDERAFLGSVKVKLGAVTTSYKGRVQFTEVDEQAHTVRMVAEGRETGGGTARATVTSQLRPLPDGQTEVTADASVDLTGRIVQVGRGMIQGVSHQLFQQFAASTKERLELPAGAAAAPAVGESAPIRIVPILFQTIWSAIVRFFRRLFGRTLPER